MVMHICHGYDSKIWQMHPEEFPSDSSRTTEFFAQLDFKSSKGVLEDSWIARDDWSSVLAMCVYTVCIYIYIYMHIYTYASISILILHHIYFFIILIYIYEQYVHICKFTNCQWTILLSFITMRYYMLSHHWMVRGSFGPYAVKSSGLAWHQAIASALMAYVCIYQFIYSIYTYIYCKYILW